LYLFLCKAGLTIDTTFKMYVYLMNTKLIFDFSIQFLTYVYSLFKFLAINYIIDNVLIIFLF